MGYCGYSRRRAVPLGDVRPSLPEAACGRAVGDCGGTVGVLGEAVRETIPRRCERRALLLGGLLAQPRPRQLLAALDVQPAATAAQRTPVGHGAPTREYSHPHGGPFGARGSPQSAGCWGSPDATAAVALGSPLATSAVGLGSPHATSAVGLGSPLATPAVGLGSPVATPAVGLGSPLATSAAGRTGRSRADR